VIPGDRDHDDFLGPVLGRDGLDAGPHPVRPADDPAPIVGAAAGLLGEEAFSGGGTGIGRPWRSIAIAIRMEAASRSASASVSAQIAQTPTAVRGAASRVDGSNVSR
jgi:hypothetical protein